MTGSRSIGVAASALALAMSAGCSGSGDPPPPPAQADPLVGLIREFHVTASRPAAGSSRVWLLDEGDGARRSRTSSGTGGDAYDVSLRLTAGSGGPMQSSQTILGATGAGGTILRSATERVSSSDGTANIDADFFRRLVLLGIAPEVPGSTAGGCTDYAAPLAIGASGVTDPARAAALGYRPASAGSGSVVRIRLCGARRELRRVATPAYRMVSLDASLRAPALVVEFRLVRARRATPALIRRTFDLSVVHPDATVVRGDAGPRLEAPGP